MNKLTVIITFKNEGIEVAKTIGSLREKAASNFPIILINDGSDDGFDYSSLSCDPYILYIRHDRSIGPGASRNQGVSLCKTDYFILMDAHMRAETTEWDKAIIKELEKQERCIYCCLTERLLIVNDGAYVTENKAIGMGVELDLETLNYKWINFDNTYFPNKETLDIPCIMGASYCCSKYYWNKIHGLNGLHSYGLEEQLLSLKTHLEGGSCKVICKVIFSHKFRSIEEVPYQASSIDFIYNKIYIIELLYSGILKKKAFQILKGLSETESFSQAMEKLKENKEFIHQEKIFINEHFPNTIDYVIKHYNKVSLYEEKN